MLELLAKDQFIDALADGDMRLQMRQSHPKSMREALQIALVLEAFQLASQQRAKPVRGAAVEESSDDLTRDAQQVSCDDVKCCVKECLETCLHRKEPTQKPRWTYRGAQRRKRVIKGNCWSRGKPGHMQYDCTEHPKQPSTNQPGNDR